LTRHKIDELRSLEGVAAAADGIEQGFLRLLARNADEPRLRRLYAESRVEPGPLSVTSAALWFADAHGDMQ